MPWGAWRPHWGPGLRKVKPEEERKPDPPKATRSVEDLAAEEYIRYEPQSGYAGVKLGVKTFFGRLNAGFVDKVKVLDWEYTKLVIKGKKKNRSAQFLAWRSSLLHTGTFFFGCIVALDIYTVKQSYSESSSDSSYLDYVNDRYDPYFDRLLMYNRLNTVGVLIGSIFAVALALVAAINWHNMSLSGPAVFASFLCSYLPPFLLLLCIPFRSGVDFEGIQQQFCLDVLNYTAVKTDAALSVSTASTSWPNIGSGDLVTLLADTLNLDLPEDICSQDPTTWGDTVAKYIEDNGFLLDSSGTCPYVEARVTALEVAASSTGILSNTVTSSVSAAAMAVENENASLSDCPVACANCTTSACTPYLTQLAALSSMYSSTDLANAASSAMSSCLHCVSPNEGLRCMWTCKEVVEAASRQALSGSLPSQSSMCVDPDSLEDFAKLTGLAMQTSYWQTMLGGVYALISLGSLLPLALSLMFGAVKGSGIAKSVIPYSRLPAVVSGSAAVFTFPFLVQIAVLVQTTIGNGWTLAGILCILASLLVSINPRMMVATGGHEEVHQLAERLATISKVLIIAGVVFFAIALISSDLAQQAYDVACEDNLCITNADLDALRSTIFWMGVRMVAGFLGKSLISTVFFADQVTSLMYYFHHYESTDKVEVQVARARLVDDLGTMYPTLRNQDEVVQSGTAVISFNALNSMQSELRRLLEDRSADVNSSLNAIGSMFNAAVASTGP